MKNASNKITLLNIDCMEYMRGLPDKAFSLALVDPPYGINAPKMAATPHQRQSGSKRLNGGGGKLKDRALNTASCEWDNAIPDDEYFTELRRVSENQIIWGGNYFPLPPTRCVIVWDKVQPWENFSQVEMAWTSFDSPAQLFKFDNRTGDKVHPCQKPIQLYEWVMNKFVKAGQRILDTHLGSGSSAIAAHNLGFEFVGMELDATYYAAACKRFLEYKAQGSLFMPNTVRDVYQQTDFLSESKN
jgi:site-specific DNA-methyltransferase (adenine-specific)